MGIYARAIIGGHIFGGIFIGTTDGSERMAWNYGDYHERYRERDKSKMISHKKAIQLAVDAMTKQMRRHAFDANLYLNGVVSDRTQKAHAEYVKWAEAIKIIEAIGSQGRLL